MEFAKEIIPLNLEDEMKRSYLDYAMSVIVGRALPDVRDGLKPVHRRVLFTMSELGNDWNKAYKKSARVVGDVMGKYHPHGDFAIYDTIVRMAQLFSMRHLLVDGQGNFGSVDGDSPAAMRYTEVRMARISHEMLADIDKETVDFAPNYDGSESEPLVLPTRLPCLLINGSAGIAVGMATNIPPHNLGEVVDACLALIKNPDLTIDELIEYVPGPDLPTAAIINGVEGIREAYHTGRGRMVIRSRCTIESDGNRDIIIVHELPYQVNKARLIEKIAELVRDKKLEGISEMRDESDKDGMRIVIELRRGESGEVVLNNLYQHTQMQSFFGINMVALVDGQPRLLNLKQILECFIKHRREVVTRRSIFELRRARDRAHIQEGLAVALANIDEIIALIKKSSSPAEARVELVSRAWEPGGVLAMLNRSGASTTRPEGLPAQYGLINGYYHLSETQAQAILEMRLHRLTGLEQDKILGEYEELLKKIAELLNVLNSVERLLEVIESELHEIREQYADPRRSEILQDRLNLSTADLIPVEDVVVTLSHTGYVKSQPICDYRAQRRGGKGKSATSMKDEDFIDRLFVASTHDWILCFTSRGKLYWLKVYDLPQASRISRGRPIVNLLPLENDEKINAILPVKEFSDDSFVFMVTANGVVKKTQLSQFSRPRANGIIAVDLRDDDHLIDAAVTQGEQDIMLFSSSGKAVRFHESEVRAMGRTATGVRGIRLGKNEKVMALIIVDEGTILCVSANGYGKRTPIDDFPAHRRGGQGVIALQTSVRNGKLVGAVQINDSDEIMLVSRNGTLVRTRVSEISVVGRNTQGVNLISLTGDDVLVALDKIPSEETDGDDEDACQDSTTTEALDSKPAADADTASDNSDDSPAESDEDTEE